jgi:hypothetical protein
MSKKTLSFEVEEEMANQIEARAAAESRSVSGFLRHVLVSQGIISSTGVVTPSTNAKKPVRQNRSRV